MNVRTMTRFGISPAALILAASLLANLALVLSASGHLPSMPSFTSQSAPRALPKAYAVEGAGEGRLGRAIRAAAPTAAVSTNPYLGEGRTNVSSQRALHVSVPTAFNPAAGEGRLNVVRHASDTVRAHAVVGQGEGWVGGGLRAEHTLATPQLTAHASCDQGEGLVQHGMPVENPCR